MTLSDVHFPLLSPKIVLDHGEKLVDVDDAFLTDTLVVAKRIAKALGSDNYNILQVCARLKYR